MHISHRYRWHILSFCLANSFFFTVAFTDALQAGGPDQHPPAQSRGSSPGQGPKNAKGQQHKPQASPKPKPSPSPAPSPTPDQTQPKENTTEQAQRG